MCKCVAKSEREGRGQRAETITSPPPKKKTKYHSITAVIKACHSSVTQKYQETKSLTDVRM